MTRLALSKNSRTIVVHKIRCLGLKEALCFTLSTVAMWKNLREFSFRDKIMTSVFNSDYFRSGETASL